MLNCQRAAFKPIGKCLAFEILQHKIADYALSADVVENTDMRVVQAGYRTRLALETLAAHGIAGEVRGQNFDCDRSVETGIAGAVHLTHAARPERRNHLVRAESRTSGEYHRS